MFVPKSPLHVVFILGTRCNLRCTHCSSSAGVPDPDELSSDEITRILLELADSGVVDVAFSGGEPLLFRDLEDHVRTARAAGMQAGTSTNGYALTPRRARSLLDAGLNRLQVSVDGLEPAHDRVRGAGAFGVAMQAVRTAVAAGLRTHVCFTAMRSNYLEFEPVVRRAVELGAHGVNLSQFVATGRGTDGEDLLPDQSLDLARTWARLRDELPHLRLTAHLAGLADVDSELARMPGFIGCHAGIYIACITAHGEITPCVMLPMKLGSLRRSSFAAIWSSHPALARLRRRELPGGCGRCPLVLSCGGCRASAWARTGDLTADDHRCWRLPTETSHAPHRRVLAAADP